MFWAPWVSSTDILQCLVRPRPAVLPKPLESHSQGCGSFLLRGAVFSSSPSPIPATWPSSCLLIKVRTALPSLPGGRAGWVHPPMATLVLWCFWLHGKCLSLHSSETPGGCPIAHLFRALSASAESWAQSMLPEGMGEPRETP